jgi:hypothetical protein
MEIQLPDESYVEKIKAHISGEFGKSSVSWEHFAEAMGSAIDTIRAQKVAARKSDDRIAALEARVEKLEAQKYLGVYRLGRLYSEGSKVTHDGSLFIALKSTGEVPGNGSADWQLAVKRGRDGKDGKDATR